VLTITVVDVYDNQKYLNQEWNTTKPPFSGDAINSYNDSPLEDGPQTALFVRLRVFRMPLFLRPVGSLNPHAVYYFTGNTVQLNEIAQKVLTISLNQIVL
jgi:hypothetical protein